MISLISLIKTSIYIEDVKHFEVIFNEMEFY